MNPKQLLLLSVLSTLSVGISPASSVTDGGPSVPTTNILTGDSTEGNLGIRPVTWRAEPAQSPARGQSFTIPGSGDVTVQAIWVRCDNNEDFAKWTSNSLALKLLGDPVSRSATSLGDFNYDATGLGNVDSGDWMRFELDSGVTLSAGTEYSFLLAPGEEDPNHLFNITRQKSANVYTDGGSELNSANAYNRANWDTDPWGDDVAAPASVVATTSNIFFYVEGVTPTAAPKITSITPLGDELFQVTLQGEAETGYEFRSSTTLDFDPGALVENLTAGDPAVGTIGGMMNSVLTTDINGDAAVQMTLSGNPADFVRAQIPPPVTLFSETFDDVTGPGLPADWTTDANTADTGTTQWQLGEPSTVGPATASSGLNCVATNLSADYGSDTDIWLRTPEIDLGTATEGSLSFQQWTQIEDVTADLDHGSVRILDASNDNELAVLEDQTIDGSTTDWEEYSIPLPDEAFTSTGGKIKVEFRFESDFIANYAGWYIDDVTITVPGS